MRSRGSIAAHVAVLIAVVIKLTCQVEYQGSSKKGQLCEEAPTYCLSKYHINVQNAVSSFSNNGSTIIHFVSYLINSTSSTQECSLNPFAATPTLAGSPLLWVSVICPQPGTRIVMRPSVRYVSPSVVLVFQITNCSVYWKDISSLGKLLILVALTFNDWQDEFAAGEPEYFSCVEFMQVNGEDKEFQIAGFRNLSSIEVRNTINRSSSPVFERYLWPSLAELTIQRYEFRANHSGAFAETMPALQSIYIYGGAFSQSYLDFPWNSEEVFLPSYFRRTPAENRRYFDGIRGLPDDIYGRTLQMTGVILPEDLNLSFHGFLHELLLVNCNLSTLGPVIFTKLTGLLGLYLNNNSISNIDRDTFSGSKLLQLIDLSYNELTSLPREIFDDVPKLENIILRANKLTHISARIFINSVLLTQVDLSQNRLVRIDEFTFVTTSLKYENFKSIDLSRNDLTEIPIWLLYLPFIENIDLSNNKISYRSIKSALQKSLNSSFVSIVNPLSEIQYKTIKLQQNVFTCFGYDIDEMNDQLYYQLGLFLSVFRLDFGNEVFTCDCQMYQLYQYLQNIDYLLVGMRSKTFNYNRNGFNCLLPNELRGKPLVQVDIQALGCYKLLSDCPSPCMCWVRSADQAVNVNCAGQNLTIIPPSLPDGSIALDVSHNELVDLPPDLPNYLASLQVLDLSNNNLANIDGNIFHVTYNISRLHLHNNDLMKLPKAIQGLSQTTQITLAGNRLVCDCHSMWLKYWLVVRILQITDIHDVLCGGGQTRVLTQPIIEIPDDDFICLQDPHTVILGLSVVAGLLALTMFSAICVYIYRREIKVFLYFKLGWRPFDRTDNLDVLNKEFDAFVAYHHLDSDWVEQELRPRLEDAEPHFRLCLHERDFVAGARVVDNICSAVDISRRMILLLSRTFLQSHWCQTEFDQAHKKVREDRTNYLIIILCDDVWAEELDKNMRSYLRSKVYLKRESRWFWEKLRYAMPLRPLRELQNDQPQDADWSGVEALARAQQAEGAYL